MSDLLVAIDARLAVLYREPLLRPRGSVRAPRGQRLGRTASSERIHAFETVNKVHLPEAYRSFLTRIGDGGVGPSYGLRELSIWRSVELPADLVTISLPEGTRMGLRVVEHGGTDATALLVSGPSAGRLVELAAHAPELRPEPDFIAWYLAWLDRATGIADQPRPEKVLAETVATSQVDGERARAVYELGAIPALSTATVELIERAALHDMDSGVRYQAIEVLGELGVPDVTVFLKALSDPKRSVSRRALVYILRLAGASAAWREALSIVRASKDSTGVLLAEEMERRRGQGLEIRQ